MNFESHYFAKDGGKISVRGKAVTPPRKFMKIGKRKALWKN
jgi:hypothetical protein